MDSATSTFQLISKLKSGDTAVFPEVFQKYARRLAILIHYKLSPEMRHVVEVEDILQETFLKACRDLDHFSYKTPGSFMSWLAKITDHIIADHARYQGRRKRYAVEMVRFRSISNPNGPEPIDTRTPSVLLGEKEAMLSLNEQINLLPEDYRQAILLAKVEGLSTRELAERLGRPTESAALLLHRAIKRFREIQKRAEP